MVADLVKFDLTLSCCGIGVAGDLWMDYRTGEKFQDFIDYDDRGLPLAYAAAAFLGTSTFRKKGNYEAV